MSRLRSDVSLTDILSMELMKECTDSICKRQSITISLLVL